MRNYTTIRHRFLIWGLSVFVTVGLNLLGAFPAYSHGGKNHEETGLSSFQAVQKATLLYDRLILTGKLDKKWGADLSIITVSIRQVDGKQEFIVQFKRDHGDPDSVYFFFDNKGEYSGSNHTGR